MQDDIQAWAYLNQFEGFPENFYKVLADYRFNEDFALKFGPRGILARDYKSYWFDTDRFKGRMGVGVTKL